MKVERFIFLVVICGICVFFYAYLQGLEQVESAPDDHFPRLFARLKDFEKQYADYFEKIKQQVKDTYGESFVQRLSRPQLRRNFGFERQEDLNNAALRFHFYAVTTRGGETDVRPVYDDFKPKLLWDKVLELLINRAFEITGEKTGKNEDDDKMSGMISMVMKGSGLGDIKEPACFVDLNLMGEGSLLYWDILYRRCPASVENAIDREKCVRGLFVAEIDRKNLIRDFYLSQIEQQPEKKAGDFILGFIAREEGRSYVEALYPEDESNNAELGQAFSELLKYRLPVFYGDDKRPSLLIESFNMTDVCVGVTLDSDPLRQNGTVSGK
jgi:hypothetical protein